MSIGSACPGGGRGMTGVALCGGGNVRRWFGQGIHSDIGATVTTGTVASCGRSGARMAHRGGSKGGEVRMTGVTRRRRWNVVGRLAQRIGPVVTGRTHCNRRGMREHASGPGCSRIVASSALRRRKNMGRGLHLRVLSDIRAAMTGCAISPCAVIHGRGRPGHIAERVTSVALHSGRNMRCWFGQCIDAGIATAVAGGAVAHSQRPGGVGMARLGRTEADKITVTGIALRRSRNMCGWLAQSRCTVMAA